MHDWEQIVREKVMSGRLSSQVENELVAELSSHLEDLNQQSLAEGLSEADAFALCSAEMENAPRGIRRIARAKSKEGVMNYRWAQ